MQEMSWRSGQADQLNVPVYHQLLGDCGPTGQSEVAAAVTLVHNRSVGELLYFAVLRHRDAQPLRVLECSTHEQRVLDAVSVVGEEPDPDLRQLSEGCQLVSCSTNCDRSGRVNVAQSGELSLTADEVDNAHAILSRVGVGHCYDCRIPAKRSSPRASLDRLCFLLARLTQVCMQVDEARRYG